ncbi:hypothetical protein MNBD_NITROSPIRAE01-976 [hydrothermal vent metagenome]|uniref:Uncharacterized protein n=1 Tax=hydrothermal vent metagenome TaxID=652676 RepID=A0A3B1CYJ1_9ZZZZ
MYSIQSAHKKLVLLALVASIVLTLCPLDHFMPMAEASSHSDTAIGECMPDICATLESKKIIVQERVAQAKLLFLPVELVSSFQYQHRAVHLSINSDSAPPVFNTLYALHATYLI